MPLGTQVVPPLIEYSKVGSGAVTLMVAVGVAQVAAVVRVIAGAAGGVGTVTTMLLLAPDTQVVLAAIRAITL